MSIISKDSAAKQVRTIKDAEILSPTAQTSTASYVDVSGSKIDAANYESVALTVTNTHGSNSIDYKVLASIDDVSYVEVKAEATLAAAAIGSYSTSPALYRYYKVQVKDTSGGTHGAATVRVIAK